MIGERRGGGDEKSNKGEEGEGARDSDQSDEETEWHRILTTVGRAVQNHPARTSKGTNTTRSADLRNRIQSSLLSQSDPGENIHLIVSLARPKDQSFTLANTHLLYCLGYIHMKSRAPTDNYSSEG